MTKTTFLTIFLTSLCSISNELIEAFKQGKHEYVLKNVNAQNINNQDGEGSTLLHEAVMLGANLDKRKYALGIIQHFLSLGADTKAQRSIPLKTVIKLTPKDLALGMEFYEADRLMKNFKEASDLETILMELVTLKTPIPSRL